MYSIRTGQSYGSDHSNPEQLHLSLAESLAAIEKISEAFDEAKQAGESGSSLRELLLVRMGKLQEALQERTPNLSPGLHFSLCRLDLHCWMVNEFNQVSAFCGQSGAAKQLIKLVHCIMTDLAPKLESSNLSDELDDSNFEPIELTEASEYLYDALISPFESELIPKGPLHIYCHSPALLRVPWSLLQSTSEQSIPLFERYRLSILPGNVKVNPSGKCDKCEFKRIQTWDTKDESSPEDLTGSVFITNETELESELKSTNLAFLSFKNHDPSCSIQLAERRVAPAALFRSDLDLSHLDLVILDNPGVTSAEVASVLLSRGVKCVFYPLWQLPRTAVRDLIGMMEDKLESQHPINALQEIQFTQKNGKRFKDPSFWSAWVPIVSISHII